MTPQSSNSIVTFHRQGGPCSPSDDSAQWAGGEVWGWVSPLNILLMINANVFHQT